MNQIRILFYTDFSWMVNPRSGWSITRLIDLVRIKSNGLADVSFTLLNRHAKTGLEKLTADRLKNFEELWIFGFIHLNEPPFSLYPDEVLAVGNWMNDGGGVLITGDHTITDDKRDCAADHDTFFAHGRALGECIPRAGQMRDWAGPPTACTDSVINARDNYNTQEGDDPQALDSLIFQLDSNPQTLLREPTIHPLFMNGPHDRIRKFPDHEHEGKLIRLTELGDDWPNGSPLPVVAARGIDKRFPEQPRIYDLVSAYDGVPAKVGRIVADSSFHHYLDTNLSGLQALDCCGNPVPGSDMDQIAQYYWNLVHWLAPVDTRSQIKLQLVLLAAFYPDVLEIWGTGPRQLGVTARQVLQANVGASNLAMLLARTASTEFSFVDQFLSWILVGQPLEDFAEVEPQVVFGSIIRVIHRFMEANKWYDPAWIRELPPTELFIARGLRSLDSQLPKTRELLSRLQALSNNFSDNEFPGG